MPTTLAIADHAATPTGAVATIAGTSGGANTVFVQSADPNGVPPSWSAAGTRTGDGTVALSLNPGFYWAYALTDPATLSPVTYFRVTDGLAAVSVRCFASVRARLLALALPCTARVYDYQHAEDPNVTKPCTVLVPENAAQTDEGALNGRDDYGNPVRVLVRDGVFRWDNSKRDEFLRWRQAIIRTFLNQRLPGVPESVRNKVEMGSLIHPPEGKGGDVVMELVIRCITREVRGLGA